MEQWSLPNLTNSRHEALPEWLMFNTRCAVLCAANAWRDAQLCNKAPCSARRDSDHVGARVQCANGTSS